MSDEPPDLSRARGHPAVGWPRHICLVTETYPPDVNGVALTLARLRDGLRARGHLVSLVRLRRGVPSRHGVDDPHTLVVAGLPLPGYGELCASLPAPRRLHARWTRHRPDVVYVATEGPLGWSAMRTARRLGVPVLSGFHTNFHAYAHHYHARWLAPAVLRYLRRFHNATHGTLVATPQLRDEIEALGFEKLHVLGRGVDCHLFSPAQRCPALRATWGVVDDDPVALYVGRLAPEKNIPLAIEAYRAMAATIRPARLVVVGDGPLRARLETAHPDVRFCGVQTGQSLAAHYASADVFLFPSETETFGNVVLEAMASGLAVMAYDYAASRLHVHHGVTGRLAPHGDARAFVEQAVALVGSPYLAGMRRRAREHALGLDWQRVVERFEWLLTEAVDERSRPEWHATATASVAARLSGTFRPGGASCR